MITVLKKTEKFCFLVTWNSDGKTEMDTSLRGIKPCIFLNRPVLRRAVLDNNKNNNMSMKAE